MLLWVRRPKIQNKKKQNRWVWKKMSLTNILNKVILSI